MTTTRVPDTGKNPAILITGVSSGIGQATALALIKAGYYVIGTVRKPEDGHYLEQAGGCALVLDVCDHDAIDRAAKNFPASLQNHRLVGIINNAGVSVCIPWQEVTFDDFRMQLEVNLIGVLAVTRAFLPFVQKKIGKIIMISSTAARFATAMMGPYSCSKYALEAMVESLRQELWHDGIQVVSIQPGPIQTPIFEKTHQWAAQKYATPLQNGVFGKFPQYAAAMGADGLPPEQAARVIVRTLQSRYAPRRRLVSKNPLWFLFQPFIPGRLFDRVIATALYGKKPKRPS